MSLLPILLPDRICMILSESSPAWEQGGVRGNGGERTPRPSLPGSGCERGTRPRCGPGAGEPPAGRARRRQLPTPSSPSSASAPGEIPTSRPAPLPCRAEAPGSLGTGRGRASDGGGGVGRERAGRCAQSPGGDGTRALRVPAPLSASTRRGRDLLSLPSGALPLQRRRRRG